MERGTSDREKSRLNPKGKVIVFGAKHYLLSLDSRATSSSTLTRHAARSLMSRTTWNSSKTGLSLDAY